ncbi:FtsW/RodA/SpoVE family cell cycle protein [Clostridium sp. YIM B02505]|uniref:FtsW/RodA/SpoVE family cell cycle protein n=1 Tax=Clostridium yunnanense TaxID=2800325 RepID=A0ABS1EL14_9CLOT|nr:FtsW/RodA/SpoVE family cell cycle protein [Clostridium yunnanense]MBK1810044.1 FtsW/RodA/SpoVE family cell cycle protein [Clostridium yunnanense]
MGIDNNLFDKFTEEVCSQIKCNEVHQDIKEELACHLEDIKEEYIAQGSSFQEAEKLAISHMGDSEKIGFDLNKVYKKAPEYKTLIICSLFVAFGLFTQFSIFKNAPEVMSYNSYIRMILFTVLGGILGIATYFFDYRKLEKYSWHIYIVSTILLIYTVLNDKIVVGITIPVILVGYSNITLIIVMLYGISFSGILSKLYSTNYYIVKLLSILALPSFLFLQTRQFAYFIVFIGACIVILFCSKIAKRYIFSLIGLGSILFLYLILNNIYRRHKLIDFISSESARNNYYFGIYNEIIKLISNARFLGNGISEDILKNTPSINNDLIYAYIIHTFGWAVGITLFVLVISLFINLLKTSVKIKNIFGKRLFIIASSLLLIEFLISFLVNLSLIPFVSASIPFLSYSGVSTVLNMFLVGLICSIYGRKNLSKSLVKTKLQVNN